MDSKHGDLKRRGQKLLGFELFRIKLYLEIYASLNMNKRNWEGNTIDVMHDGRVLCLTFRTNNYCVSFARSSSSMFNWTSVTPYILTPFNPLFSESSRGSPTQEPLISTSECSIPLHEVPSTLTLITLIYLNTIHFVPQQQSIYNM